MKDTIQAIKMAAHLNTVYYIALLGQLGYEEAHDFATDQGIHLSELLTDDDLSEKLAKLANI